MIAFYPITQSDKGGPQMDPWKRLALTVIRVQAEIAAAKPLRPNTVDSLEQKVIDMEVKKDNDRSFDTKNPERSKRQPGKQRGPKRVQEKWIDTGYAGASGPWMVRNPAYKGHRVKASDMAGSMFSEAFTIGGVR